MNIFRVQHLLKSVEHLHLSNSIANYSPAFDMDSVEIIKNVSPEKSLTFFLDKLWEGRKYELTLTEFTDYHKVFSINIDSWLKRSEIYGKNIEPAKLIGVLADAVKEEILTLENPKVYKVETVHEGWYECEWLDLFLIDGKQGYFMHLGFSD